MQALFLVETKNDKQDSDYIYISTLIDFYFNKGNNRIRPIYLDGKSKYNKKEKRILSEVNAYKKSLGTDAKTVIFLCIDIDNVTTAVNASENIALNKKIESYCRENGYELIWFYEDIEEVFLGKKVHDTEKHATAIDYKRQLHHTYQAKSLKINKFNETRKKTSNILTVLEKYFQYK